MDELERRLGATAGLSHPDPATTARARAAVLRERPRRTRLGADAALPGGRRRLAGGFAAAVVLLVAAVAATLAIIAGPHGDTTPATPPRLPEVVRTCTAPSDGAAIIGCVEGAAERRLATPELREAPWLYIAPPREQGRMSSEPLRPSLAFPPGVSYPEALSELYVWVALVGTFPPSTTVAPPLPDGVVLLRPDDPAEGIAIDLRAPWGYQAGGEGLIYPPSLSSDAGLPPTPRAGELWTRGARVDVPALPDCQTLARRDAAPTPCTPDVAVSGQPPRAPALPLVRVDAPAPTGPLATYVDGPRCSFEPGVAGIGRAVVVEVDFVNFGTAGVVSFTGGVMPAAGPEITRTVRREIAAGERPFTVTVRVPLAPDQRVHLFRGQPPCRIDTP